MKFRLLKTGHQSAAFNMALDEVIAEAVASGESDPCLRLYGWQPAAVSIGYFQSLAAEVDEAKCEELGVDVIRRQTGGGAVFHDQEVTYSMHVPLNSGIIPKEILPSYEKISQGIILGLAELGLNAEFAPLNDILLNGQKISGNAQTRKKGIVLQHGTILLNVDVDKMFELLKVPDEKMKGKLITVIKQRVTSVNSHLNSPLTFDAAVQHLENGFFKAFPECEFLPGVLSPEEIQQVEELVKTKYSTSAWNHKR